MKTPNLRIIFAGTPKIGATILEDLIEAGLKIQLVLTKADKPSGRGKKITSNPVKLIARKFNIPTLSPTNLSSDEVISQLRRINPDLIIVAAYGKIFPKVILDLPKYGVLNFHPSLLPKFRGPSPIQFAILEGGTKTGITIIKMSENLDEGDILTQVEVPISKGDTALTLSEELAKAGAKLLIDTIEKWILGKIKPKAQEHLAATYTAMLTKYDGKIDLGNLPDPQKFDRMVRAYYPWPGVWTKLKTENEKLKIIKFLPGNLIQLEGKLPISISQCKNDYPEIFHQISQLFESRAQS